MISIISIIFYPSVEVSERIFMYDKGEIEAFCGGNSSYDTALYRVQDK